MGHNRFVLHHHRECFLLREWQWASAGGLSVRSNTKFCIVEVSVVNDGLAVTSLSFARYVIIETDVFCLLHRFTREERSFTFCGGRS